MARLRTKKKQRKSNPPLKHQKPKKLRNRKMIHENDAQKPPSQFAPSSPQSSHQATENVENLEPPENPCLFQNVDEFGPRVFSTTLAIQSRPSSPETPSHLGIQPCKNPISYSLKMNRPPMIYHWNKKKLETLTKHFNPIPFSPKTGPSDIEKHKTLLTSLGIWEFLHLDFDQEIRTDLIKEVIVCYNPKKRPYCKSYANGLPITLSRGALANALHLPVKSQSLDAKGGVKNGFLMVSEDEALFLEELVWGWLVLQDDGCKVVDEVLKFKRFIRERRLEKKVDWAGLIWSMVERELLKGQDLVNCYYASHLNILLKHQRPKLFDTDIDVKRLGSFANMEGDETNLVEVKMVEVEDFGKVDIKVKEEDCVNVVKNADTTEIEEENENILVKCYKRRSEYLEKSRREKKLCVGDKMGDTVSASDCEEEELEKQQNSVELLDGNYGTEQQIKDIVQDQHDTKLKCKIEGEKERGNVDELKDDKMDYQRGDLSCMPANELKDQGSNSSVGVLMNQDNHEEGLKTEVSVDLISSGMDDLNMKEVDNQQTDLVANEECDERKSTLEVSEGDKNAVEMLVNQDTLEEDIKTEQFTDLTLGGMDDLNVQEVNNHQINLVGNPENGEQEGFLEEKHRVIAESSLDDQYAAQMEPGDGCMEMHWEKEEMEGCAKETCQAEFGGLVLHNRNNATQNVEVDLSGEKHTTFQENALDEKCVNQEGMRSYGSLKRSEENVGPGARIWNVFLGADKDNMQVTLNAGLSKEGSNEQADLVVNQESDKRKSSLEHPEDGTKNVVDMLVNQDINEQKLKIEKCTHLTLGGMDDLNVQEADDHQIDLVGNQDNGEKGLSIEASLEEKRCVIAESISDEQRATQMEYGNGCVAMHCKKGAEVMEGLKVSEAENGELQLHNRNNTLQNVQVDLSGEKHNTFHENASDECGNQEGTHSYYSLKRSEESVGPEARVWNELLGAAKDNMQVTLNAESSKDTSDHVIETEGEGIMYLEHDENGKRKCQLNESNIPGLVLKHCSPRNVEVPEVNKEKNQVGGTNIFHDTPKICSSTGDLYSVQGFQLTCKNEMTFSAPKNNFHHSFTEPCVPKLDVHARTLIPCTHVEARERKNIHTTATFVENFEPQPDIYMNLACSSFDNSLSRGISNLNYSQYEHETEMQKRILSSDAGNDESLDIEFCTKQMEIWMSRLKNAANKRAQIDDETKGMLHKKLEEQNKIIQQCQKSKHEEQQKKQKDIYRYERELRLMQNVVCDYRKALKEVNKSFAKYRERCQLPEEALYRDDPCGGGNVILAAELKQLEQKRQDKAIQISIETLMNFLQEWIGKLEGHLVEFDYLCDRLEDIEIAVYGLKGKFSKP